MLETPTNAGGWVKEPAQGRATGRRDRGGTREEPAMYTLRPATPADAPFLARVDLAMTQDAGAPPPPAADGGRPGARAQRQIVLVAGQPVGVVAIERDSAALVVAELRL